MVIDGALPLDQFGKCRWSPVAAQPGSGSYDGRGGVNCRGNQPTAGGVTGLTTSTASPRLSMLVAIIGKQVTEE